MEPCAPPTAHRTAPAWGPRDAGRIHCRLPGSRSQPGHTGIPPAGGCQRLLPAGAYDEILNGGAHAANSLDTQEFILPGRGAQLSGGAALVQRGVPRPGKAARAKGLSTAVGDEGGFAPDLASDEEALELVPWLPSSGQATAPAGILCWGWTLPPPSGGTRFRAAGSIACQSGQVYTTDQLIAHWQALAGRPPVVAGGWIG